MFERAGRIELDRAVDSITVGVRHRVDMGDLEPLIASIKRLGLLHPITVTPDGILVCGRRRLEAVKLLGWRTMRVWVRSGLSDKLTHLLAQQDENALRKPLTVEEQATLYRELKKIIIDDAADRKEDSRFGAADRDFAGLDGAAGTAKIHQGHRDTRREAAELVTQSASYTRLEQVSALENIATDDAQPFKIRQLAQHELGEIRSGGSVLTSYQRVMSAIEILKSTGDEPDDKPADPDELEKLAHEALARAKEERFRKAMEHRRRSAAKAGSSRRTLRSLVLTWRDLDGWSAHYDAEEVGTQLGDDDWAMFERVLDETSTFACAARDARAQARQPAGI